ncbi:MAG: ATP-binding cassette domain-containing protein [Clostridiales bacterium]|nr:ATP-binding cassette domain-containing protein [Clostridiales bacterium]
MLELQNVTKRFNAGTVDETTVFDNFSFKVEDGEFVSVIGSNGSGKTTLLNLICGSLKPDAGKVYFCEKDITATPEFKRAKYIGRVFQDTKAGTCSQLTILENLALADNKNRPFGLGRCVSKKRLDYYKTLLEQCDMGLENRVNVPVGTLSGGQRQALALVIANMTNLKLLILDEHTAALDPKSSERVMELTQNMVAKNDITTIMVTHNLRFSAQYGSRLVMMNEGRVILDIAGAEKQNTKVEELLKIFDEISIDKGN